MAFVHRGLLPAVVVVAASAAVFSGCASPPAGAPDETRAAILEMRNETIAQIAEDRPGIWQEVADSAGYAVFSNRIATALVARGGSGYGVVVENLTGERTWMRAYDFGVGLGVGARTERYLILFPSQENVRDFIEEGYLYESVADASAGSGDGARDRARIGGFARVPVYRVTEEGFEVEASVGGMRFAVDETLNGPPPAPQGAVTVN